MINQADKLVREIDGHKFYSKAHASKEDAMKNRICGSFYPSYEAENKSWYNFNNRLGFQEDIHERP